MLSFVKLNIFFIYKIRNFYFKKLFIYVREIIKRNNREKTKHERNERNTGGNFMSRVLISMPEKFLDEIDQVAENENRSRSELIREALRTYIHRNKVRENTLAAKNATILETLLD